MRHSHAHPVLPDVARRTIRGRCVKHRPTYGRSLADGSRGAARVGRYASRGWEQSRHKPVPSVFGHMFNQEDMMAMETEGKSQPQDRQVASLMYKDKHDVDKARQARHCQQEFEEIQERRGIEGQRRPHAQECAESWPRRDGSRRRPGAHEKRATHSSAMVRVRLAEHHEKNGRLAGQGLEVVRHAEHKEWRDPGLPSSSR